MVITTRIGANGVVKYQDDLYQGKHEAIISKDIFDQVQQVRKSHA
jgi:hypothetical protein